MEYIDLKEYLSKLLKNWLLIALCCVIALTGAFIYSEFFATPMYSSSIKISVSNTDWSQDVSINDIQTTVRLIENCVVVLEDDVMAEEISDVVYDETGERMSVKQIKSAIQYTHIGDSGFLKVSATTSDPELSAILCNAVSARAPELIVETVANVQVRTLGDGAKVNENPVSPNTGKNMLIGVLLALVLSCGGLFLYFYFDNTVDDEEKLTEKFGLSVLGIIPNISNGANRG